MCEKEVFALWEFGCRHATTSALHKFYADERPETVKEAFFSASLVDRCYNFSLLAKVAQDCADYCAYFKKLLADVRNMNFSLKPVKRTPLCDMPSRPRTWWNPPEDDYVRKSIFSQLMSRSPHLIPFFGDIPFTFDKRRLSETYIYRAEDSRPDNEVLRHVCSVFSGESFTHGDIFDHALPCIGCYTAEPALVFSPYRSMRELNAMPELKAFSSYIGRVFDKTPYIASVKVIPSIYLARRDYINHGKDCAEDIKLDCPWATALDGDSYGSVAVALSRKCIDDETYGWSFFYWLLKSNSSVAREYRKDALAYLSNVALAEINRQGTSGLPPEPVPQSTRGVVDYCADVLGRCGGKRAIKKEYRLYKDEIFNARSDGSDAYEEQLPKRAGTIRQLMWKSLPHTCSRCGERIESMRDMHVDHIIPLAKGGTDTVDNMQLLHKACNLSKGAKLPTEPEVMKRYKK
jgi:5-methylcytosine-specific restriction endonuclease McrA